ncbi:glycosyltransferase [Acidobacterium sp. S8]|uniref:glycosyltransferase n=1 Tax=Acidobacterium sp. S8 TaxID=1641854 RepID=UPI0020B15E55|nr:glycosyltransferase [Acidobacterium sp. S8]
MMRIAVVHDYFTQLGGAEKVAEEIVRMLPQAVLHSTVALPNCMPHGLADVPVITSWMQHLPGIQQFYRFYFLLYPLAVRSLDLSQYDLVISSSSGYVKGVCTSRDALHVCYCHTPMRWVWSFDSYSERESFSSGQRLLLRSLIHGLRAWDMGASRQPDHFIANSRAVAARISRAYGRHAEVIHPPIDLNRFAISDEQSDYYLVLARLVSYKRIDLAIQACNLLRRRLLVIGDGPDRARLTALAGPTVSILGRLSDRDVQYHAARCRALLFPGEEDFGMAPLEIAAAGRPTIAYRAGGAMETIIEDVTGVFFDRQEPEDLAAAIERCETIKWSEQIIRSHAKGFGVDVFQMRMRAFLTKIGARVRDSSPISLNLEERTA